MQDTAEGAAPPPAYSHFEAGPIADWSRWAFAHPRVPLQVPGKVFVQERLGLTGLELSLNSLPPGAAVPFLHRHRRNEEVYVFVSGRGQFQVDGVCFAVGEGSVVRVSPAGSRAYRNTGETPLVLLVIQAPANSGMSATIGDGERLPGAPVWP
jgi:mannose-6-phosphate isomerase-like protein (cupin superfamily)